MSGRLKAVGVTMPAGRVAQKVDVNDIVDEPFPVELAIRLVVDIVAVKRVRWADIADDE
jgi:hypothetical protein